MNITQLVELAQKAWSERPIILGLPGGDLSPEERAGDLIRNHGLNKARMIAEQQDQLLPAPWSYHHRVWRILDEVRED